MLNLIPRKREVKALGIRKMIGNSPIKSVWFIGNGFDSACKLKTSYIDFFGIKRKKDGTIDFEENGCPKINNDGYLSIKTSDKDDIIEFKKKIKKDIRPEKNLWADVEIRLAEITKDYGKDIDTFLQCFDDLHTHLNKYLKDVEKKAKHEDFEKVCEEYEKIYNNYFKKIDIETTVFVVLNYTDNFENFIKTKFPGHTEYFYCARIIYIHGNLSKNETVLGVGDPSHIKNPYFKYNQNFRNKFLKYQITDKYTQVEHYFIFQGRHKISKLNVNIFGCSMGQSDNAFWHLIFGRGLFKKFATLLVYGFKAYNKKLPKITLYNYTSDKAIKEFENFSEKDKQIFGNSYKSSRKLALMTECFNMTNFIPIYFYFLWLILKLFPATSNWMIKIFICKLNNVVDFVETNNSPYAQNMSIIPK